MVNYVGPFKKWNMHLTYSDKTKSEPFARDRMTGALVDLGFTTFLDDVARQHLAVSAGVVSLVILAKKVNDVGAQLQANLFTEDYKLNGDKTVHVCSFQGQGSYHAIRTWARDQVHLNGKAVNVGRHLGLMVDSYGHLMYEVRQRCRDARVAVRLVGGRGWCAPLPRSSRRSLFAAFIHLFVVMTSLPMDQRHYKKMDSVTQQLLKKLSRGTAVVWKDGVAESKVSGS